MGAAEKSKLGVLCQSDWATGPFVANIQSLIHHLEFNNETMILFWHGVYAETMVLLWNGGSITHPIFIIKMQGIWIFISDLYFHGILYAPLRSCYGVMSNAISHILMFHTPTTPYNICNYFTICTQNYYIKPYILSHIIPTFFLPPTNAPLMTCPMVTCPLWPCLEMALKPPLSNSHVLSFYLKKLKFMNIWTLWWDTNVPNKSEPP